MGHLPTLLPRALVVLVLIGGIAPAAGDEIRVIYDPRPEKIIFVKGDPKVKYERVVHAMDVARGSGVKVIGVPPKDTPGSGK